TLGTGVDPELDARIRPTDLLQGKRPSAKGEIALDEAAAKELGADIGSELTVARWGDPITLKVVGIVRQPGIGLGVVTRPETSVTLEQMGVITDKPGTFRDLDVVLKHDAKPEHVARA